MSVNRKRKRTMNANQNDNAAAKAPTPVVKKLYKYTCDESEAWTLPTPSRLDHDEWFDDDLQSLKDEINEVKGSLSDIDIGKWHSHTGSTQLGGAIQRQVQKHAQAELCTQAWCKFHEILCHFDVVRAVGVGNLKSVHLCEAPGAFVASLNHFLKSRGFYSTWEWLALSSNPYYESSEPSTTICDDSLMRETRPNWFFGEDNSGDLLKIRNLLSLVDRTGKWTAHLVTADGSINCADRPAEQEQVLARLHLAEVVAALHITAHHGTLVLKMFTFFEASSVSLLYLLNFLFTDVYVFKPMSSKPGNSEVYIICEDYRGIEQNLLNKLTSLIANDRLFVLPRNAIPDSFMQSHRSCCTYFAQLQTQTIRLNLDLYYRASRDWLEGVMAVRLICAKKYIEETQLKPIHRNQKLMRQQSESHDESKSTTFRFSLSGSFNQRLVEANSSWRDRMADTIPHEIADQPDLVWLLPSDIHGHLNGYCLKLTVGTTPVSVRSSRYCAQQVLDNYNMMLNNVQHTDSSDQSFSVIFENLFQTLTCDTNAISCVDLPGHESDFIRFGTESYESGATTKFYLSDITATDLDPISSFKTGELKSKMRMYDIVAKGLKNLSRGDFLVCRIYSCLTRFTVSVVYLLKTLFSEVTVSDFGDRRNCYVVCRQFLGIDNCLIGRLLRARNHGDRLLQLIPVDWMEAPRFRNKITQMNHQIIVNRLNTLIMNERKFLSLD